MEKKSVRRNAPGPRGDLLIGSFRELQRQGQVPFYLNNWRKYGDIVRFQVGPIIAHIIAQPDHVQYVMEGNPSNYGRGLGYAKTRSLLGDGVLTSDGEVWRRERELMEPLFTREAVAMFEEEIVDTTKAMVARWDEVTARGETIDLDAELRRLSIQVMGRTMLGTEPGQAGVGEALAQAYDKTSEFISRRLTSVVDVPLWLPTAFNRRFTQTMRKLDRLIYQLIRERRSGKQQTTDLLSRLTAARVDATGERLSDKQIRDEIITVLFAGHETAAELLTWTWYELAQHHEIEAKLRDELTRVIGANAPSAHDLANLTLTNCIIQETLRLYPSVWTFPRQAIRADEIGGYHIPAGSMILISPFLTHRHASFWENPETFDPDRFTPERSASRTSYAYLPFGGGARVCLGRHLVMFEAGLVLATVAPRYHLHLLANQRIEPVARITLRPSVPVLMGIERWH
jgi:cytochrome P450